MKKVILLAVFSVAGLVSAKNTEESKTIKETERKEVIKESESPESEAFKIRCIQYSMWIPCQEFFIDDQMCYGEGTGVASWDDAWNCITENGQMATFYFCGV